MVGVTGIRPLIETGLGGILAALHRRLIWVSTASIKGSSQINLCGPPVKILQEGGWQRGWEEDVETLGDAGRETLRETLRKTLRR